MPSAEGPGRRGAICTVAHKYYPDTGHLVRDAEALREAGFEVHLVCLRRPGEPAEAQVDGVRVHRLPVGHRRGSLARYCFEYATFLLLACLRVAWLQLRHRFRVIEIVNMPDLLALTAVVPRLLGAQVVLYIFDNMPELLTVVRGWPTRHPLVRLLAGVERAAAELADRVIVTQEPARRLVVGRGVAAEKVSVVLNGPDERLFAPRAPRPARVGTGPFRIVTHGAILERFGLQTLLDALPELTAAVGPVEVAIYGAGEYRPTLEQRARRLAVDHLVDFRGLVPPAEIPDLLLAADVGYVGMLCDLMLSNKLMEYVALGLPVALARWPTYEHYFPDDCVAYFEPGDARDLARALADIWRDPVAARARAARAAERYAGYRWSIQRERYLAVYGELAPAARTEPALAGRSR